MKRMILKKKKNILLIIIILTLINIVIFLHAFNILSKKVLVYAKSYIKRESNKVFKSSYQKIDSNNKNSLIRVIKNENDEILMIDFDIEKTNTIVDTLVNDIDKNLSKMEKYTIYVPLGIVSNNKIISNMGPKVPIKINVVGSSFGKVRTKVLEYGINSVLLEIYIDVKLNLEYNLAFKAINEECNYSSLIDSKIISGKVPDYYEGDKRSTDKTINIPIKN